MRKLHHPIFLTNNLLFLSFLFHMLSLLTLFKWFQCIFRSFLYLVIAVIRDRRHRSNSSKETQTHNTINTFSNQNIHDQIVYKDHDNIAPLKELNDIVAAEDDSQETIIDDHHSIQEVKEESEEHPLLTDFDEKCPPRGGDSVVFYTTSLRGIRKTFEDCRSIRFVLDSFEISVQERDVSMDMEFREELWRTLGDKVFPPKLFIKGRYIGGADEVFRLHEQGKLKKLLEGIPSSCLCTDCADMRFLVCSNCNGSRKVFESKEGDELCTKCPYCNENGLVKCLVCS